MAPFLLLLEAYADFPELLELRWPAQLHLELLLELPGYLFLEVFQLPDQLGCLPFVDGQEIGLRAPGLFVDLLQFPEEVLGLPSVESEGRLAEVDG